MSPVALSAAEYNDYIAKLEDTNRKLWEYCDAWEALGKRGMEDWDDALDRLEAAKRAVEGIER